MTNPSEAIGADHYSWRTEFVTTSGRTGGTGLSGWTGGELKPAWGFIPAGGRSHECRAGPQQGWEQGPAPRIPTVGPRSAPNIALLQPPMTSKEWRRRRSRKRRDGYGLNRHTFMA